MRRSSKIATNPQLALRAAPRGRAAGESSRASLLRASSHKFSRLVPLSDGVARRREISPAGSGARARILEAAFRERSEAQWQEWSQGTAPDEVEPRQGPLPRIDLPPNAAKEQVKEYINSILLTTLRRKEFKEDDPQVAMLVKVGAQNLDALLEVRSGLKSSGKCGVGFRESHTLPLYGCRDQTTYPYLKIRI